MDWDSMRERWQHELPAASMASVKELQMRERDVQRKVRRRDRIEAVAAVFVGCFFAFDAVQAAVAGNWPAFAFALLLVAWAVFVPLWMRRARRMTPVMEHRLALLESLHRQRAAALAQARMLEQVWLWYLTPPVVGLIGLTLAREGLSTYSTVYSAAVLALAIVLGWLNRYVARIQFRAHAGQLERQINDLAEAGDGGQPTPG